MSKGAIIVLLIAGLALGGIATLAQASDSQWVVDLVLHYGYVGSPTRDNVSFIGVRSGATNGYDAGVDVWNVVDPPGGPWVDLYFYRTGWDPTETAYAEDWRAEIGPAVTETWQDLRAAANADAGDLILTWTIGLTGWEVPEHYVLTLVDEDTSPDPTAINMRTQSSYTFPHPGPSGSEIVARHFHITVFNDQNLPPNCDAFTWSPLYPIQGEVVTFDGTGSYDTDGTIVSYEWDYGDGTTPHGSGSNPTHSYVLYGTYTVTLTVTDDDGASTVCVKTIEVAIDPNQEWNCQLRAYWGSVGGTPRDVDDFFGVRPLATDDYDGFDAKKPVEPIGNYVYAWFARPNWGAGNTIIMHDWRAPIAENTSKVWGTGLQDTWSVKTNLDNGGSGYYDPVCDPFNELQYPIAASVYVTWEFGVAEEPPYPAPPEDYIFTLQYKGGINAKPAGTKLGDATVPAINETWDMETTSSLAVPLWNNAFQPWTAGCDFAAVDTAKFKIIVFNPPPNMPPHCEFTYSPTNPDVGQTVNFDGSGSYDPDGTIVSYDWDFGDGNTGSGVTTSNVYTTAGPHEACLTVTDEFGASSECCETITAYAPPTCNITYSPEPATAGVPVSFDSNASDPDGGSVVSADWTFGDTETGIGLTTTHTYASAGTYTVDCTVTDDEDETGSCQLILTVEPPQPTACFDILDPIPPAAALPGQPVLFDASCSTAPAPITSYAWTFGDTQSGSGVIVSHPYSATGVYTVTLTITDDNGGTDDETKTVTVEYRTEDLDWNCNLKAYWGALEGAPRDLADFFGVQDGATDGFDLIDAKKPVEPVGDYLYAWFERPSWGQGGRFMHDWRSPLPMGTSKVWGTALQDTWSIKTNLDNGGSGYYDPTCDPLEELQYPIAASIYLTWEFGIRETPPPPLPPTEYTFTLIYKGGINAKPAGTKLGDATVPTMNETWDMETTPYIVVPLWNNAFQPWTAECGFAAVDTAKLKIIVEHPLPCAPPTCDITVTGTTECATMLTFNANATPCTGRTIASVAWDFGDGGTGTGDPGLHAYGTTGDHTVTCTVTDSGGLTGSCQTTVTITAKTVSFFLTGPAWHMISLPCEPIDPDPAAVFDELDPWGPVGLTGNLHRYDPVGKTYRTWNNFKPSEFGDPLKVCEGYWLYIFEDVTITYEACCGYGERECYFPDASWYMIGHPQFGNVNVRSADMQAELGTGGRVPYCGGAVPTWIGDPLTCYDPSVSSYDYVSCSDIYTRHELVPFEGYWADVKQPDLKIYVPTPP